MGWGSLILIDPREGSKELYPYLLSVPNHPPVEWEQMPFGDFAFAGNGADGFAFVGIEYKLITDALNCKNDGRFGGHQGLGLLSNYTDAYLMVEGSYRIGKDDVLEELIIRRGERHAWSEYRPRTRYQELMAWFQSLRASGISVIETRSKDESAAHIVALYHWFQKPWRQHNSLRVAYVPTTKLLGMSYTFPQEVASRLPGVGSEKAIKVAKLLGSVADMCAASEEDWMKVPGIGKVLARKAVEKLHER